MKTLASLCIFLCALCAGSAWASETEPFALRLATNGDVALGGGDAALGLRIHKEGWTGTITGEPIWEERSGRGLPARGGALGERALPDGALPVGAGLRAARDDDESAGEPPAPPETPFRMKDDSGAVCVTGRVALVPGPRLEACGSGVAISRSPSPSGGLETAAPFASRGCTLCLRATALVPIRAECVAMEFTIPAKDMAGLAWRAGDTAQGVFPEKYGEMHLWRGRADSFSYVDPATRKPVELRFPQPMSLLLQDSRLWGPNFSVRIVLDSTTRFQRVMDTQDACPTISFDCEISHPDGIVVERDEIVTIAAGSDWIPLENRKNIVAGSALDFSAMGWTDAPAGKHGWLKAVDGHFEFEGLPGVEQRFYGVNLCETANFPDHAMSEELVARLKRLGYNSIRFHHHDEKWKNALSDRAGRKGVGDAASGRVADDEIDRFDYLAAVAMENGLYLTTDLYVSRKVAWREIGIDRDGAMNMQLYKTYVGNHDGAFSNWCHWAQAFLEHVNPYTGRAYKDEPGMPFVSLVNEGKLSMSWGGAGKALDPVVRAAWREFGGDGDDPPGSGANTPDSPHDRFDAWINRRIWERCSAFVRSLGCRALLTNDNNGRWHGEGEGLVPLYDYVDNHFYVDHPVFLDQPWRLPSKCLNANPIQADLPALLHRGYAKGASKPYAISEWNFSGPGRYRGVGGLLTGALAAEQEWDALWRFAYAHRVQFLPDDGKSGPNYFDCATDPLIAASDRASVFLFLRGDALRANDGDGSIVVDRERGTLAIDTPRTCGGFAESGRIDAGPLSFEIVGDSGAEPPLSAVPATLWVSSLDGEPVSSSSRLLLVHLTDVQGEGTRYADESRTVLLKWGGAPLVEAGAALVELRFDPCEGTPAVFALDTAGNSTGVVPSRFEDGVLRFRVRTCGPDGGRIYYEITRQP